MARPLRIDLPNGVYYVTSRGLERQGIARDEQDCARWFELLGAVATRRRWRVFALVMMPSHYHLLLETPEGDLSAGMHDLNSGYASAFNRRYGRRGPLFAGRFKAILVEPGYRYWELSRHMHLNPVRAGQVKRPQDWPFGSCEAYLGTAFGPAWLAWRQVLEGHGATLAEAQENYERSLAEGVAKPPLSPLWGVTESVFLGSGQFVGRMMELLARRNVPAARASRPAVGVEAIERAVCAVFGVAEGQLRQRRRRGNEARAVALYLCRKWTEMPRGGIGERFGGVSAQAVSKMALQVARQLDHDRGLAERIGRCEAELELTPTTQHF